MNPTTASTFGRPLEGIRIVEIGVWHAGPGGSAILADLGAQVIKVETLDGDPERHNGDFGPVEKMRVSKDNWSLLFEMSNRNKRSICIDIRAPAGRAILDKLVADADIFVTNLRSPSALKLGIDYAGIAKVNPKIIHLSTTGFGPEGPLAEAGGFDPMGQAISGMLFLAGTEDPTLQQMILLDQMTAIAVSQAALTALVFRERTGEGQDVHVSLFGTAIWLLHANLLVTSVQNEEIDIRWNRKRNPPLRTTYKCGDGGWIIGTNHPEEKYWSRFCRVIGRPDLADDPRFATKETRAERREEIVGIIDEVIALRDRDDWLQTFRANEILFAPVQRFREVLQDPQALANGYIVDFDHPLLGTIKIPGYPVKFGKNHAGTHSPAPELGQHTSEILKELGYAGDETEALRQSKVIG